MLHPDMIYQMTSGARQYATNCRLAQNKAKEIITERKASLQDSVSTSHGKQVADVKSLHHCFKHCQREKQNLLFGCCFTC